MKARPLGGRLRAALLASLPATLLTAGPAQAIEEVLVRLPLLETSFSVRVSELSDPQALSRGNSDLAELDRASGGAVGRQLRALLLQPVPLSLQQVADGSVGSPLLEQAMLVISSFGTVQGQPADLTGETLRRALRQASGNGRPTLLSLIQAIPGQRVTLDLSRAQAVASRMASQRQQAEALIARQAAAPTAAPPAAKPAGGTAAQAAAPLVERQLALPVAHRRQPLDLQVLQPAAGGTGRLVLISHGLWDGPASFLGWARLLAAHGYTVILPRHPGSDNTQQRAVLAGSAPPPSPRELALRPLDLRAVLDGAAQLKLAGTVDPQRVVVLGHSWGATTALQLAGLRPTASALLQRCANLNDPERNLSWTLQCSWLQGVSDAAIQDRRVLAVGAVSPPVSLLFPRGSGLDLSGRVLLVSGSQDWVVPPDPEAITPMRRGRALGNQLVLARGGDHFNLRPGSDASGGVLGPLLLSWTDAAFTAGDAARPSPGAPPLLRQGAWGNAAIPLLDATPAL